MANAALKPRLQTEAPTPDHQVNPDGSLTFVGEDAPTAFIPGLTLLGYTPDGRVLPEGRARSPQFQAALAKANAQIERAFGDRKGVA